MKSSCYRIRVVSVGVVLVAEVVGRAGAMPVLADATLDFQAGTFAGEAVMPADSLGTGSWSYLASAMANPTDPEAGLVDLEWDTVFQGFERPQFAHTNGYDEDAVQLIGGELLLHPGNFAGNYVLMRWTAGAAGPVAIDGLVRSRNVAGGDGRRLLVYVDGQNVLSQFVAFDDAAGQPFALSGLTVGVGSTVDFVVDRVGTPFFDGTGLAAVISAALLVGDYNGDGFVSQADLDLVLLNWGDAVAPAGFDEGAVPGGGPFDGLMGQNELDGVLLNWGNGTPPTVAVPEPTSLALLGLGGLAVGARRRGVASRRTPTRHGSCPRSRTNTASRSTASSSSTALPTAARRSPR